LPTSPDGMSPEIAKPEYGKVVARTIGRPMRADSFG